MNSAMARRLTAFIRQTLFFLFFLSSSAVAAEKVVLQLKWFHQFQSAGYYAALEKGFFAEEGLDVELRERDLTINNLDQVALGEADYGVTDSIVLLQPSNKSGVVLVAPIFQHSPNVLMTLRSSNITRPKELIGRRLAFYDNDTDGIALLALLAEQGVLKAGLLRYDLENRISQLISGDVDAIAAYSTNEPHLLREMGYSVNIIDPKHYGIDFYGDMLFTSTQEAENNPERVAAMRRAVLRGWEYALDHQDEIIDLILEKYNTQSKTREVLLLEAHGLEPLIARYTTELGSLSSGRLEYMLNVLSKTNIIDKNLSPAELEQKVVRLVFESPNQQLNLTPEERAYLASQPLIRVGVARNWPPFEFLDESERELQGVSQDYLKLLEELLELEFEVQEQLDWSQTLAEAEAGRIELLPALTNTVGRRDYLSFTRPYIRSPMVIVTNYDTSFIADMRELNGKRVAVVKDHAPYELMMKYHPLVKLDIRESAIEALEAVASGETDAFIDNLAVVSYLIRTEGLANLKISGQTPYSYDLSMGVSKDQPLLQSILDKTLQYISVQHHHTIYDSWVSLENTDKGFPWRKVLPPFFGLGLILAVLGYYTRYLFKLNKRIQVVNMRLKQAESTLKEKNVQLEKLSVTDKLTGVYNRHYLDKVLSEQLALVQRYENTMSVALFDLDYFKHVNDEYGHQTGDKVLKVFADLVQKQIRTNDVFGRWGGEEFLLIYPGTNKAQATEATNKIRKALEAHHFDEGFTQTVSAGVVEATPGYSANELLSLVDKRLYLAKEAGRNQVVS